MAPREGMQDHLRSLQKAFFKLKDALRQEINEYIRDSIIKRYEFTFELLWKLIKKLAESENLECYSPKSSFKLAFRIGLIDDEAVFLSMLEYRNRTVHIYEEEQAEEVYRFIKETGVKALEAIISKLEQRIKISD